MVAQMEEETLKKPKPPKRATTELQRVLKESLKTFPVEDEDGVFERLRTILERSDEHCATAYFMIQHGKEFVQERFAPSRQAVYMRLIEDPDIVYDIMAKIRDQGWEERNVLGPGAFF